MKLRIVLVIVMFVFAAIFVGLTVWGGLNSGSSSTTQPTLDPTQIAMWFGGLRDALDRPPALTAQEIEVDAAQSTCAKSQDVLIVPTGATCTFNIMPAKASIIGVRPSVRKLIFSLIAGSNASIVLQEKISQDNGNELSVSQTKPVESQKPSDALDVYSSGGTLTVACQPAAGAPAAGAPPCWLKPMQ